MNRSRRLLFSLATFAFLLSLTGCDKLWELGQKLKAPEPPVTEIVPPADATTAPTPEEPPPPPEPQETGPIFNPSVQVSILGYHDFSATRRISDMVIHPDRVRTQMEAIKKANVPVIRMSDYLAWKKGQKNIPDPCIVITCDDGWEGVYTDAYPIFKEYGYPFSIYIYRNYIGGSGRSLSIDEIREMMANGCEIGSHSVSHADLTKNRSDYDTWLQEELVGSLEFLRATFGVENVLPVFAYPYGKYNTKILELCKGYGYELGITVAPKKAAFGEPNLEVGRFIIHGDDDTNFNYAMSFKGALPPSGGNLLTSPEGAPAVTLWPEDQGIVTTRLPRIEADLSQIEGIEPGGVTMRVSGFGEVPCVYDSKSGRLHFQVTEPLRSERCQVTVRLQRKGQEKPDYIKWAFEVDLEHLYFDETLQAQPLTPAKAAESGN
jgi:peptidoglycan/xylan/chitin deacetylase (PgdA/CDA1 family)